MGVCVCRRMPWGCLLQAPVNRVADLFHGFLNAVRQIAEEVDACILLQLIDCAGVVRQRIIAVIVFRVFKPESEGTVVAIGFFQQEGGEEVFGHDESLLDAHQYLALLVNGSSFADVEGVACYFNTML